MAHVQNGVSESYMHGCVRALDTSFTQFCQRRITIAPRLVEFV